MDLKPVEKRILQVVGSDSRVTSVDTIAERAKCTANTVYKAMSNSTFREAFNDVVRGRLHAETPGIIESMVFQAKEAGNYQAAKMLLEITGLYDKTQKISGKFETKTEATHLFGSDEEMEEVVMAAFPQLFADDEDDANDA